MAAKIFRINYKSDFILTLESDAGWMTPFCIKFWTGAPSQAFFAGWDGTTYTHCSYDPSEPTKLVVQFDDHHLPIGDLKLQIAYHFTVADFPNDTEDEVINPADITTMIDGQEYQVMLDFTGETAPEIQFSLPAYANEAQRIENEQQRIENEQQRIANEQERIDNEQTRQRNEGTRIENEQQRVQELGQMKGELEQATRDAAAAAENANEKGVYAKNQGDYAKQQGDYAKQQGDIAKADHERAEEDHRIAGEDHTQAGSDHTRAGEDHTQAGSDHTRAGEDHTQAGNDHTRADQDHTRAESDHAAVEVYVDSLGAFDISAYHATGGVLATYANLQAALGTNGANIPDALRKGGMSVKFVQGSAPSSDNKYVMFFCNSKTFSTKVSKWEKVNLEKELKTTDLLIGKTSINVEVFASQDGKYIQPTGYIGSYADASVSSAISVKKGDVVVAKMRCNDAMCAIGRVITENSRWEPLALGDTSNEIAYFYAYITQDCDVQFSYYTSYGIDIQVCSSEKLCELNDISLYNYVRLSNIIPSNDDRRKKISKLVKSIKIYPIEPNSSLDDYTLSVVYVGFHDTSYENSLVVQIRYVKPGTSEEVVLTDSYTMPIWIKGHVIQDRKNINNIPVIVEITLSDEDIVTSPVVAVSSIIIPENEHYSLPQKQMIIPSFNLMNYDTIEEGWMVNNNGTFENIGTPWVLVKWVVVKGLSKVTFGHDGIAGIGAQTIYNAVFFDANKIVISGTSIFPDSIETIDVPTGAVYMCFTDKIGYDVNKHQVNAGESIRPYDVYKTPYYITNQDEDGYEWFFNSEKSNEIHIGEGAEYLYNEIQPAINAIWNKSISQPFVLIVHPKSTPYAPFSMIRQSFDGSYPWSNVIPRNISIIGLDKVNCVIQSNTGDYYHPASELLANGTIQNLTFRLTNSEHLASSTQGGYAAHIDARTANDVGYNMILENCDFESATGPAAGIGTHTNGNLIFRNCRFVSTADPTYNPIEGYNNLAHWGCVFAHSAVADESATNQKITFECCSGYSALGSKSLWISNAGSTTLFVTLLRNVFWSINEGRPSYDLANTLSYNAMNFGNNIPT